MVPEWHLSVCAGTTACPSAPRSSEVVALISRIRFVTTLCIAAGLCVCLSACSGDGTGGQADAQTGSQSEEKNGARLADSLQTYIERQLDQARSDDMVASEQIAALERAVSSGTVEISEYERAWSGYRQCMIDRGEPEPVLWHYSNGMYVQSAVKGDDAEVSAFQTDSAQCQRQHTIYLNAVYGVQQGNPSLYEDQDEAVADCLRRDGIVPESYTADDLRDERASEEGVTSFDTTDMAARSCMVSNGWVMFDAATDQGQIL